MSRFSQTFARIAAGYSVIGALIWLLWPSDLGFADNPEAWFALATAFFVWHLTEFKKSEELVASEPTDFDVIVASRLVRMHQDELRYLLRDLNQWSRVDEEMHRGINDLIRDWRRGSLFFSSKRLQLKLSIFMNALEAFSMKVGTDTTSERIGKYWVIGYKPIGIVPQEEYDRLMEESKVADKMASNAWRLFNDLVEDIRTFAPSAYLGARGEVGERPQNR
ncbi:MAG: hypothetical protein AAGF30_12680 [Pseudomonadota bacterium]